MTYSAKVVADSIAGGKQLTTLEVTFPRYILAEFNTHRVFSRNSASSRAIPVKTRVQQVRENPFIPEFTKNRSGMQADAVLIDDDARNATAYWRGAARMAADMAESLAYIEVHKQQANRLLEPFAWHTALVTSTYWDNFFALRDHPAAAPEIQTIARMMKEAMVASTPKELRVGEWHLPYVDAAEWDGTIDVYGDGTYGVAELVKVSVARCAAISYERQYARKEFPELYTRHDDLKKSGHWSPFEHQAKVAAEWEIKEHAYHRWVGYGGQDDGSPDGYFEPVCIGNFEVPWFQYRKMIPGEAVFHG